MSKRASPRRIEPSLFDELPPVFPIVTRLFELDEGAVEDLSPDQDLEYRADVNMVKDSVLLFMRSFYRQFFFYGYGLDFASLDKNTMVQINAIPQSTSLPRPDWMILSVNDFVTNVSGDLVVAGYGGGSIFAPKTVFCSSLFNLMKAFISDGRGALDNYEEIAARARDTVGSIGSICQQSS